MALEGDFWCRFFILGLQVTVKFAFDQPTPSIDNYSVKNRVRVCSSSSHAIKDMPLNG